MRFKSLETCKVGAGRLRSLEIGVTSRCNFRCDYCGAYDLSERRILSVEDMAGVIDALPDLERVKLSGGEVLLEFDTCEDIIRHCTERGIFTQVNSNGTLLNDEKFERLEDAGLGVLHFSLNHVNAASHSAFYRVTEKMFHKIVYAIRRAVASPSIDTVVETILFDETESTLAQVHRFAVELGVRKHEIQMEIPSLHQGYENTLGPDRICGAIARLVQARDRDCTLFFSCLSAYVKSDSEHWQGIWPLFRDPGVVYATCVEGKAQLHLHSNGDVMICELGCPEVIGNVFEQPMLTIFETSQRLQQFIQSKHQEESFSCFRHADYSAAKGVEREARVTLLPMPQLRGRA